VGSGPLPVPGTLSLLRQPGPRPAVVLLGGSGRASPARASPAHGPGGGHRHRQLADAGPPSARGTPILFAGISRRHQISGLTPCNTTRKQQVRTRDRGGGSPLIGM
jgi:hypothetical protein